MKTSWRLCAFALLLLVAGCHIPIDSTTEAVPTATVAAADMSETATSTVEMVTPGVMPLTRGTPAAETQPPAVAFATTETTRVQSTREAPAVRTLTPTPPADLAVELTPSPTQTPSQTVAAEPVALRWRIRSIDPAETRIYEALGREIDASSAEFTLTFESNYIDYMDILRAEVMDGTAPDVFWLPGTYLADFVKDGLLKDLLPLSRDSETFNIADYYVGPMLHLTFDPETGLSGDRLWGLPRDVSPLVLYLNLDLLEESGADDPRELAESGTWDWETFAAVAEQVSAVDADTYGFGQYGWWGTHGYWIQGAGGDYFNATQDRCGLDSAETVSGLTFERSLYQNGLTVPLAQAPETAFYNGKVGMYLSGRWQTPILRQAAEFKWDVVTLPTGPARDVNMMTWGAFVVSVQSEAPDAAWELVQQLTSANSQAALAASGLTFPSRVDAASTEAFLSAAPPENNQAFIAGISNQTVVESPLWAGEWARWDATVNTRLYQVMDGSLSPAEFAATICDEANLAFDLPPSESSSTR